MRRLFLSALASSALVACQPAATELTDTEKTALADSIGVVLQEFWDAWAETDFDRGMLYYLDSPDMTFSWGAGRMILGFDAADASWRPMFETVEKQVIDMADTHINVLDRDVVSASQRGSYTPQFRSGDTGPTYQFSFTTVWVRADDGWKIIAGHQSDTDAAGS